jgi:hypothetical protein
MVVLTIGHSSLAELQTEEDSMGERVGFELAGDFLSRQ